MISAEHNDRLTRVGPGTPMGALLRRYWHPVLASIELVQGRPLPVRLLGEDLIAFRQPGGALALTQRHCPHRGVSLQHGVVDGEGITCPYHGWKFAGDGRCLRMPSEPGRPELLERARLKAYRLQERGGLVFAYLGPEPAPLLPPYDLFTWDGVLRDIGRALLPCNWLQIMENSVDPVHVEWLHGHHLPSMRGEVPGRGAYARPHKRIAFDRFEHGIVKRRLREGDAEDAEDWTIGHPLVFPNVLRVGAQGQHRFQIRVPVDDTHTLHFWYACYLPPRGACAPPQAHVPVYEVPWRDPAGGFITDFVDGGDIMCWVSQGPIADRTREMLVSSDSGIAIYRRLLQEQMERVAQGQDPMGVLREPPAGGVIEFEQEHDKFGGGAAFLRNAMDTSHARHSPIREDVLRMLGGG